MWKTDDCETNTDDKWEKKLKWRWWWWLQLHIIFIYTKIYVQARITQPTCRIPVLFFFFPSFSCWFAPRSRVACRVYVHDTETMEKALARKGNLQQADNHLIHRPLNKYTHTYTHIYQRQHTYIHEVCVLVCVFFICTLDGLSSAHNGGHDRHHLHEISCMLWNNIYIYPVQASSHSHKATYIYIYIHSIHIINDLYDKSFHSIVRNKWNGANNNNGSNNNAERMNWAKIPKFTAPAVADGDKMSTLLEWYPIVYRFLEKYNQHRGSEEREGKRKNETV